MRIVFLFLLLVINSYCKQKVRELIWNRITRIRQQYQIEDSKARVHFLVNCHQNESYVTFIDPNDFTQFIELYDNHAPLFRKYCDGVQDGFEDTFQTSTHTVKFLLVCYDEMTFLFVFTLLFLVTIQSVVYVVYSYCPSKFRERNVWVNEFWKKRKN